MPVEEIIEILKTGKVMKEQINITFSNVAPRRIRPTSSPFGKVIFIVYFNLEHTI